MPPTHQKQSRAGVLPIESAPRNSAFLDALITWALVAFAALVPWGVWGAERAVEIAAVAWIGRMALRRRFEWKPLPVNLPLLVFVLLLVVSAVVGVDLRRSLRELVTLRLLLVIYLVGVALDGGHSLRRLFTVFVASLTLFSLYATVGRAVMIARREVFRLPLVIKEEKWAELEAADRVGGQKFWAPDLGTMNEAGQLLLAIPLAVGFAAFDARRRRWMWGLALVPLLASMILNFKRGAWLALVVVLLVVGLATSWKVFRYVLAGLVVLFVALLAIAPARHRLVGIFRTPSTDPRVVAWKASVDLIRERPLGVGFGNSGRYAERVLGPGRTHFHSNLVNLAVEASPAAATALAWWVVAAGVWMWRGRRRRGRNDALGRIVALAAFAGALGFFLNGLVEYNFGDSQVVMVFYLLLGAGGVETTAPSTAAEPKPP